MYVYTELAETCRMEKKHYLFSLKNILMSMNQSLWNVSQVQTDSDIWFQLLTRFASEQCNDVGLTRYLGLVSDQRQVHVH